MTDPIRVAIVGAGMAGLTAAVRLAERGFAVTVFEKTPMIGGQFGAHNHKQPEDFTRDLKHNYYEHCYHMLLNWYHNFWQLTEDLGIDADEAFEPRSSFRYLTAGSGEMPMLTNVGSPRQVFRNLFSGVAPPPDLFAYSYSLIDLLAQQMDPRRRLDRYSVNGFLQTRRYATERSAELHEHALMKAFASPSYLSSATSYQNLIKFGMADPEPFMWILKSNSWLGFHRHVWNRLGGSRTIFLRHEVTELKIPPGDDRVREIYVREETGPYWTDCYGGPRASRWAAPIRHQAEERSERPRAATHSLSHATSDSNPRRGFDYVIVAVPPRAASALVPEPFRGHWRESEGWRPSRRRGRSRGERARVDEFRLTFPPYPKLKSEPMASLDLHFKRTLPNIPKEHVILLDSRFGLTFIDNGQAWGLDHTALNVIATDYHALSNLSPDLEIQARQARQAIIDELRRFVRFDEDAIDWDRTHFQTNVGDELFINEVGSEQWRPGPKTACPNMFLAGDYCRTPIDVTTIEGAVVSGLQAVKALQDQAREDGRLKPGDRGLQSIDIIEPEAYSRAQAVALKLLLAPTALAAKTWSWAIDRAAPTGVHRRGASPAGPRRAAAREPRSDLEVGLRAVLAPWAMGFDMARAGLAIARDVVRSVRPSRGN